MFCVKVVEFIFVSVIYISCVKCSVSSAVFFHVALA